MLRRLSAAIQAGRRAAGPAPVPEQAPARAGWALVHFGDPGLISAEIAAHAAFCAGRGLRCLLISDDIPALCIGSREILFEFLPWPAAAAPAIPGGFDAAVDHSFRRLSLILEFWQVVGCNWLGPEANELLELAPDWAHPVVRVAQQARGTTSQIRDGVLR